MKKFYALIATIVIIMILVPIKTNKKDVNESNYPPKKEEIIETEKEMFQNYLKDAEELLTNLSLDEKIGQLLMVRNTSNLTDDIKIYQFGSVIFFEKDFKNKTEQEVKNMINSLQNNSKIPLLTAIDEEGGKVSRLSSNKELVSTPFLSSQELYKNGGFQAIRDDVLNKSKILYNLGLNLNLAPVVDIAQNKNDYIYGRTIGLDATLTSIYAKTVIETSKETNVSYTLKHFPGYGSNLDTHSTSSVDTRTYDYIINNDLLPFKEGINNGAEAVMISHNIVTAVDKENPASLSKEINNLLRNNLNFTGIIITDDLSMKALKNIDNIEIKALLAGNDILITSDYKKSFNNIKDGINNNLITIDEINEKVLRILAWKYYKQLL